MRAGARHLLWCTIRCGRAQPRQPKPRQHVHGAFGADPARPARRAAGPRWSPGWISTPPARAPRSSATRQTMPRSAFEQRPAEISLSEYAPHDRDRRSAALKLTFQSCGQRLSSSVADRSSASFLYNRSRLISRQSRLHQAAGQRDVPVERGDACRGGRSPS